MDQASLARALKAAIRMSDDEAAELAEHTLERGSHRRAEALCTLVGVMIEQGYVQSTMAARELQDMLTGRVAA